MKMKNYKSYIIGGFFLLLGLAIGWVVKPTNNTTTESTHDHFQTSDESSISEEIWTCSMHPQIRQNEPGICPICEMNLIPLDNSMDNDDPTILRMSKEAAKLAQIETFIIGGNSAVNGSEVQQASPLIKVDGTVELDERTIKSQTAHLSGRIETMAVTFERQFISKGQKIASIYSTELLAASQELLTAAQYNDKVEGLKDAAIQKLKNWKITDDQIQEILNSGTPIETIDIYADHAGNVINKKLSQGDYVKQGQSMYTLGSTSRLWLIFNVFESDLANVKKGNNIVFTTPSVPSREFKARITYIEPLLNSSSRTAIVRAEINNSNNQLKPGMLLNGMIATTPAKASKGETGPLTIPNSAILWTGDRSVVYVQVPDSEVPSYEFREVEISNRSEEFSTIKSGVNVGDEIVTQGAFVIDAAAQLNNNYSMMNREVKVKKEESAGIVPSYVEEVSPVFMEQLDETLAKYIEIKNALVDTDSNAAMTVTDSFLESIEDVDMIILKGDAHMYWMEQSKALKTHGEKIKNATDVEAQRNQFDFLSQAMINSVRAFGTNGKTYYVQYCPMAKDNQGADWISTEAQIKNPYFGDKMMKCGSVKLELN